MVVESTVAFTPEADEETLWKAAFDVDLMHCVRDCRAAIPALADSDAGSIVLISSVSSVLTELPPQEGPYGAMKAAMLSYAGQLAHSAAADGVRVNAVSPGPVSFEGGVWDHVKQHDPDTYEFVLGLPALGRMGTPEEIDRTVVFLASPASSFTTGATVRVDGGPPRPFSTEPRRASSQNCWREPLPSVRRSDASRSLNHP